MSREGLGLREGDGPENCSDRDLYLGMELSDPEIPTLDQGESYQFLANLEMQRFLYPGTQPCPIPPLQHTQEGCPGRARVGNETKNPLGVQTAQKSRTVAFGHRPLPHLPWRRKAGACPAALRAGLPRPCRGGEGSPGPGRGRGGRSDAAGRDSRGAGGQTGKKVGTMGPLCASGGSGSIWNPRPGLGAQRTPTLGPAAPARAG